MKTHESVRLAAILCAACMLLAGWGCKADVAPAVAAEKNGKASAGKMTEVEKIEALIATVAGMKDAVFIRNGREYDGKKAAEHLRDKWEWKKDEIRTARDFIRIAASGSSLSGKPYVIRFADGREVKSADFFTAELEKLEAKTAQDEATKGDK